MKLICSSCGTRPTQHKKAFSYLIQGLRRHIKDSKMCWQIFVIFHRWSMCMHAARHQRKKKIFINLLWLLILIQIKFENSSFRFTRVIRCRGVIILGSCHIIVFWWWRTDAFFITAWSTSPPICIHKINYK